MKLGDAVGVQLSGKVNVLVAAHGDRARTLLDHDRDDRLLFLFVVDVLVGHVFRRDRVFRQHQQHGVAAHQRFLNRPVPLVAAPDAGPVNPDIHAVVSQALLQVFDQLADKVAVVAGIAGEQAEAAGRAAPVLLDVPVGVQVFDGALRHQARQVRADARGLFEGAAVHFEHDAVRGGDDIGAARGVEHQRHLAEELAGALGRQQFLRPAALNLFVDGHFAAGDDIKAIFFAAFDAQLDAGRVGFDRKLAQQGGYGLQQVFDVVFGLVLAFGLQTGQHAADYRRNRVAHGCLSPLC